MYKQITSYGCQAGGSSRVLEQWSVTYHRVIRRPSLFSGRASYMLVTSERRLRVGLRWNSTPCGVIWGVTQDMTYGEALNMAGIPTLEDRRQSITWKLFLSVLHPKNCLHHLLPAKRNHDTISRLRLPRTYPLFKCRTERFKKSFFPSAISKFGG